MYNGLFYSGKYSGRMQIFGTDSVFEHKNIRLEKMFTTTREEKKYYSNIKREGDRDRLFRCLVEEGKKESRCSIIIT